MQSRITCLYLGIVALIWVVMWQILVSNSPEDDCHISFAEKKYILESLQDEHTSHPVRSDKIVSFLTIDLI